MNTTRVFVCVHTWSETIQFGCETVLIVCAEMLKAFLCDFHELKQRIQDLQSW